MPSTQVANPSRVSSRFAETGQIAHLLRRTGFGASSDDVARYTALGFEGAVDALLDFEKTPEVPDRLEEIPGFDANRLLSLQTLWLWRMANTSRPLQEKMALFWHGHFATANSKVNEPTWMWNQYGIFRDEGLGNFRTLVKKVAKDPAMMRWLDTITSKKGRPNENFARELFELFTLGIGNYTENDIKESARAFTGWEIRDNDYFFNKNQFDTGSKTVLGKTGNLTGEDVIDIAVEHPATAHFIAAKLYKYFVDDDPQANTVDWLAGIFTDAKFEIKPLLRAILLSKEFRADTAYHGKIKNPAEYVVGLAKTLQVPVNQQMVNVMNLLGQALFNPPSVKGWPDGPEWVSASTLLNRVNFANQLITGRGPDKQPYLQPADLMSQLRLTQPEEIVDYFLSMMVNGDASETLRSELVSYLALGSRKAGRRGWDGRLRAVMHLISASPVFQFN